MNLEKIGWITLVTVSFFFLISCGKEENDDETNISHHNETRSHNMGQNCFNCHKKDGSGKGIFTIAGTVYDSAGMVPRPNGWIKFFTHPNGQGDLVKNLQVDAYGNFFTTEIVNITMGVYAVAISEDSTALYMPEPNVSGQCNNCHNGIDVPRVWVP